MGISFAFVLVSLLSSVYSQFEFDYGGLTYPSRNVYQTFANVDTQGNLINYGFQTPLFGASGLPTSTQTTSSTPYALVQYFSNTTTWEKYHDLIPFEYLHLHYNPKGHTGGSSSAWQMSHFDVHFSLEKPEYIKGISCSTGHISLCSENPLFYIFPGVEYFPTGSWTASDPVEEMGIHWTEDSTTYTPTDFSTHPANLFVSFDGKMVMHEPMISVTLIQSVRNSASKIASFSFPRPQRHAKPGYYFDTFEIFADVANGLMVYTCKDLYRAEEWYRDTPVYIGPVFNPSSSQSVSLVSSSKNCHIESSGTIDGGYEVTYSGSKYCCLKKMPYRFNSQTSTSECVNDCTLTPYLGNTFIDSTFSRRCFSQCYSRV